MSLVRRPLDATALRDLLGHKPCRLALLSACHSEGLAETLLDLGVEHVVVISADDAVLDIAARTFAARFYQTLLAAQSVQEAFERAVAAVRNDDQLRQILDPTTFEPVNLAEAAKFRLLPAAFEGHAQPLVATIPTGDVVLRRPPWSERTNLSPAPSEPFVGRQAELHAVHVALRDARCIVIPGLGGIGKTALADAVGRWQHERARWVDGVYLIELRNLDTASAARQWIALGLGITETSAVESDAGLALALRDRQMLLILDDLDVLRERDQRGLTGLLRALLGTRSLRLIVTTRRPLPGEIASRPILLNRLGPLDALRAFREYAPPDIWGVYTPQVMGDLLGILDGYPFPIRLAATFMVQTRCGIVGLLNELRADALGTFRYPGDEEDRNSSLAATLVLSYRALPEAARNVLPILALFPAGLSREAAKAILGEASLAALQSLYLYALAELRNDQGYQRYALPEPARRYAESPTICPTGTFEQYAPQALAFYAELIGYGDRLIATEGQIVAGRVLLTLELPNWRRFLEWGFEYEQGTHTSMSARATGSLNNYWTVTGEKGKPETLNLLIRAQAAAKRLGDRSSEANVLKAIGDVQQFRDDRDAALASYQQALGLFKDIGDRLGEANVLKAIGDVQQFRKQSDAALASYQQALGLFKDIGAKLGEANVYMSLGDSYLALKQWVNAIHWYEQALPIYRTIESLLGQANTLIDLGKAYFENGQVDDGLSCEMEAGTLFAQIGSRSWAVRAYRRLIEMLQQIGRSSEAQAIEMQLAQLEEASESPRDPLTALTPLLTAIAAIAQGTSEIDRATVEQALADLELRGFMLRTPVTQIWQGERNEATLIAGLDDTDAALVRRVLELVRV